MSWKRCDDELPGNGDRVLVYAGECVVAVHGEGDFFDSLILQQVADVTHWQRLPELPEGVSDGVGH